MADDSTSLPIVKAFIYDNIFPSEYSSPHSIDALREAAEHDLKVKFLRDTVRISRIVFSYDVLDAQGDIHHFRLFFSFAS